MQRRIQDAARRPVSMFESSGGVYYSPDSTVRRQSKDVGTVRSVLSWQVLMSEQVRTVMTSCIVLDSTVPNRVSTIFLP